MGRQLKKMKMKNKNNKIEVSEDRLSNLPDSILVSILNCLPIDSAAATSVLSHRWQFLWTQRDSIYFPPKKIDKSKNYEYFITTFDHIISKLTTLNLNELTLVIPCVDRPKSSSFMLPLITKICQLNPKIFHLLVGDAITEYYCIQIPPCLLQTQSLFALSLCTSHKFEFMLPDDGLNFPNLKYLHLFLHDSNVSLLGTFTKSCPLLKYLYLKFIVPDKGNAVGDIIAPNLKFLSITYLRGDFQFVIATPVLEEIHLTGQLPFIHFVTNPTSLRESSLDIMFVEGGDVDYQRKIQGLFQQISSISSLDLGKSCPLLLSNLNGFTLPIFHNIIHLSLHSKNIGESSRVPLGLLCKLKTIECSQLVFNGIEMKFLEHVLSNAPGLEELHFSFCEAHIDGRESGRDLSGIEYEYKFCTGSMRCYVKFSASSYDYRISVFTALITFFCSLSKELTGAKS